MIAFIRAWWKHLTWKEVIVLLRKKTVCDEGGNPVMTQFTILGVLGFHLRIHWFSRGDGDSYHTHPRGFVSLCIRGSYHERLYPVGERIVRMGTITMRKPKDAHNVTPIKLPCVTLVVATPVLRQWSKFKP
jgi:hypothetical protein